MKYPYLLLLLALCIQACGGNSPEVSEEVVEATKEETSPPKDTAMITPILHGSVVFQHSGKTVYVDPYGGTNRFEGLPSPDLVLITHPHGDHLDKETLRELDLTDTELMAPQAVIDELGRITFGKVTLMENGDKLDWNEFEVEAVPMYNLPETDDSRHKKGWGNGYVLTMGDRRHYISGDTEDIEEMRNLQDIDVAFVCMNLPYTMSITKAAEAVVEFKPDIVYPYHFRNGDGTFGKVESFKRLVNDGAPGVEVRLAEWYPGR